MLRDQINRQRVNRDALLYLRKPGQYHDRLYRWLFCLMLLHEHDPSQRGKVKLMDRLQKLIGVHEHLRRGFLIRPFLALMLPVKVPRRYRLNRPRCRVGYRMELIVIRFFHH